VVDFYGKHGLRCVINAGGTETILGAAPVSPEVCEAMIQVLPLAVVMEDLQRYASRVIARVIGAEAGCVTACADASVAAGLAGCMTGDDIGKIERLPDTDGMRNEVIVQRAHVTDAGGMHTLQLIRMTGAKAIEVGMARVCRGYHLESAINERTAAVYFVMNQEVPQSAILPLHIVAEIAHHHNVPVVVDAAIIYDLSLPLKQGADLVAVSGHKVLEGPTSGLTYGRKDLVRASYLQERGIARPMKVGKESVMGVLKALELYSKRDHEQYLANQRRKVEYMVNRLKDLEGIEVLAASDAHTRYMMRARMRVDREKVGLTEYHLVNKLAERDPLIKALDWLAHGGQLEFDLRYVTDDEVEEICRRIEEIIEGARRNGSLSLQMTVDDWRQQPYGDWPD